ncbi:hypothetical protein Val02_52650 [Virgisporangium aliadipatigenens]|uniref:Uncharacterized protein n=1 Tax=Virgisporangium aliadipatigenens TaxID=741659 RepID=A0A8J3YMR7_9ACTN|nr:hypothetical protein [Virgisporangium aliadipatigenens]GIJ48379.1 hypothetical protein Val02_52650 [Virgisporangium aliadipatigenens]
MAQQESDHPQWSFRDLAVRLARGGGARTDPWVARLRDGHATPHRADGDATDRGIAPGPRHRPDDRRG